MLPELTSFWSSWGFHDWEEMGVQAGSNKSKGDNAVLCMLYKAIIT